MPQVSAYGWQAVSEGSWFRQQEAPGPLATGQPGSSRARPRVPGLCCPWQEPLTDGLQGDTAGPSSPSLGKGSRRPAWEGLPGRRAGGPGAPPPPAPGPAPQTSGEIYLATWWEHHLCPAVAQSGPSPAPSLGAQMSLGPGPAAGGHNRGKAVFCSSANGNTRPVQRSRRLHVREAVVIRS